jgi:hypothetical protein
MDAKVSLEMEISGAKVERPHLSSLSCQLKNLRYFAGHQMLSTKIYVVIF